MGPQRGVSTLNLHSETGEEVNKFHPDRTPYTRFEVQDYPGLVSARLVFSDSEGNDLSAVALRERLGTEGGELVKKYHGEAGSDFWLHRLNESGAVELLPQGGAFAATLPAVESLQGLSYRFEGFDNKGQLLGDLNLNGRLEPEEATKLPFNDPFSAKLDGKHNWQRYGIIEESRFEWRHDQAPRKAKVPAEQIVYQIHPGSIFGSHKNVDRTSFKEIMERLDYFEDLGVNTLEIMPVDSTEGNRDWG
jgi:1,4-alpha-glucan branching enzyme